MERLNFPLAETVPIALREIARALRARPDLREVRVVCFDEPVYAAYRDGLAAPGASSSAGTTAASVVPEPAPNNSQ